MFQDEVLVEVLLIHLVNLGGVHKVDNLADTIHRLAVVDSNTISHPGPCSRLRLSEGYEAGRGGIQTFAEVCKPGCGIVLDQGCTGDLTLAKVLASSGFISRRGLAVELPFPFFLFFELADLSILFFFAFCLHIHRGRGPFAFRRIGPVLGKRKRHEIHQKHGTLTFFFSPFAKRFALYSSSF